MADELSQDAVPFASVVSEATVLGVLSRGALSPLGAALVHDALAELLEQAERLLPAAASRARLGSDLTAVVMGTPSLRLMALLDAVADRETRGTAWLWRFSGGSIRRALDAGRSPEEIETGLAAVTDEPLPQPLRYLIADTARRHGQLRVVSALCVIHGDDPALVAEIGAHRKLARLGVRQVAPTVLVCGTAPNDVLTALRAEGYAPVGETAKGTVRVERPKQQRAAVPGPRARQPGAGPTEPAGLPALAARLSAGSADQPTPAEQAEAHATGTEKILADWARQLSPADRRQLAHALDTAEPITVSYVAASGAHTVRTLSDLELDPPNVYAWCHLREAERVFTLSRIRGVMPGRYA